MNRARGFTLIELMITVAVLGILVAVAYPSYTNSLKKGTRANAKSLLMDVSQKEQAVLLDRRSYVAAASCSDLTSAVGVQSDSLTEVVKYYTCSVTVSGPPPGFIATLTPIAGKRMAGEAPLTINQAGAKTGDW